MAPEGWDPQLLLVLVHCLPGSWGRATRRWTGWALPGRAPSLRWRRVSSCTLAPPVLAPLSVPPGSLGLSLVLLPLWTQHLQFILLGTPLMFFSLLGGTPKPEPEQVIKKYTEELKTAPDEVCVTGATHFWFGLGMTGWPQKKTGWYQHFLCREGTCQGAPGRRPWSEGAGGGLTKGRWPGVGGLHSDLSFAAYELWF